MSRKSQERRKARLAAEGSTPSTTAQVIKKRRNRRLIFVALIGISFPILELIAYRFRAITVTIVNRSKLPITDLKVIYTGGAFDAPEVKPGGSLTRLIRPDFSFKGEHFAQYLLEVHFVNPQGIIRQGGRVGTIDFSAHEIFTIESTPLGATPLEVSMQIKHSTSPGFPLSLIRDLFERLGIG